MRRRLLRRSTPPIARLGSGAQNWFCNISSPHKKLLLAGPAHLDRPVKAFHNEMLRWYDQWLKGMDTGILDEPWGQYRTSVNEIEKRSGYSFFPLVPEPIRRALASRVDTGPVH